VSFITSLRRLKIKVGRLVINGYSVTLGISIAKSILIESSKLKGIQRPTLNLGSLVAGIKALKANTTSPFNAVQNELRNPLTSFFLLSKTSFNSTAN